MLIYYSNAGRRSVDVLKYISHKCVILGQRPSLFIGIFFFSTRGKSKQTSVKYSSK